MNRPITGFVQDEEAHWVATLSCGHTQHARHNPPFTLREWVETEAGRAARIGSDLDCVSCDRAEMPAGHAPYQQTKKFSAETVPKGLLAQHTTKRGVWAQIHVESGELDYTIEDARVHDGVATTERLRAGRLGTVIPEIEHHVAPVGEVSFYVEFWRSHGD